MKTRTRPLIQDMSLYTKEDLQVWNFLFNRQMTYLKEHACEEYLQALNVMNFNEYQIPDISKLNEVLLRHTGWKLQIVQSIVDQETFFHMLFNKTFPVTVWLREPEELDYIEEPDMFHDVFGHVPLLMNQAYANFFHGMASIALKHQLDPEVVRCLGNIYWFTIEFGLMRKEDEFKIYGAGIFSSLGESKFSMSDEAVKRNLNIEEMIETSFRTYQIQPLYFVAESFEQLYYQLDNIETLMDEMTKPEVL